MLSKRALIETSLILFLLSILIFTLSTWDAFNCGIPLNIWLLLFALVAISTRSLYLLVLLLPSNFTLMATAACVFFFALNPMHFLISCLGLSFAIVYLSQNDPCGASYNSYIFFLCLALSVTNTVLAMLQSVRIYKSMRFLRETFRENYFQELLNNQDEGIDSFTHQELLNIPVICATAEFSNRECCICHEFIQQDEMIRELPGCGHTYHQQCVDSWLMQNPTCPLCRNNVRINVLNVSR